MLPPQATKGIGATAAAKPLLDKAGVVPDAGIVPIDERCVQAAGRAAAANQAAGRLRKVSAEPQAQKN